MRTALDAIRRRPGRSALTALGIGLATALVVVLLAVSAGIQSSATSLAAQSGVDLVVTSANTSLSAATFPEISGAHPLARGIPQNDSNVETASPWLIENMSYGNASMWARANASANGSAIPSNWAIATSYTIGWIPSDNAGIDIPPVYTGPGFTYPGDPHYSNGTWRGNATNEVVLDQGLAGILHVVPGQLVWMGQGEPSGPGQVGSWYRSATPFLVVGISGPFWLIPSSLLAFTYLSQLQSVIGAGTPSQDYASVVLVHLYDNSNPNRDRDLIETAYPGLTVFTIGSILGAVQNVVNLYRTFGDIVAALALVVAALFTTAVLLMSVDERSNEIALRRALGIPSWSVGGSVVEESVYLGLIGLAVGLPLAYLASYVMNLALDGFVHGLPAGFSFVSFEPAVIAVGILVVIAIGLGASVVPAARAVTLPIAEEIRAP